MSWHNSGNELNTIQCIQINTCVIPRYRNQWCIQEQAPCLITGWLLIPVYVNLGMFKAGWQEVSWQAFIGRSLEMLSLLCGQYQCNAIRVFSASLLWASFHLKHWTSIRRWMHLRWHSERRVLACCSSLMVPSQDNLDPPTSLHVSLCNTAFESIPFKPSIHLHNSYDFDLCKPCPLSFPPCILPSTMTIIKIACMGKVFSKSRNLYSILLCKARYGSGFVRSEVDRGPTKRSTLWWA